MQQHDDWYPIERDTLNLTLVGLTVPTLGEVGVRVRYEELVVLPAVAYEELAKVNNNPIHVCTFCPCHSQRVV